MIRTLTAIMLGVVFLLTPVLVSQPIAQEDDPAYSQKIKEIDELKQKISQLQGEAKTLSSTIQYLNNKQQLAQKQIEATQVEIEILERDIESISGKIDVLQQSLEALIAALLNEVQIGYKQQSRNDFELLFSSHNFSQAVNAYKYIQATQQHHQTLLTKTTQAKLTYDEQKQSKEKKQQTVEALQKRLVAQREDLIVQEKAKQQLLVDTKNNEQNYQKLLAQALAEKAAIEKAIASGVPVGPVKRGDVIALTGNSGYPGCSSGKHLHFEVRKNNTWVDPSPFLESKTVIDGEKGGEVTIGTGNWSWPLEAPIRLTQHYGHTPYSWRYKYSGGIHTGFDMVSKTTDVIRAPADGKLYKSTENCGSSSVINIVYIDHGDNVLSFYLHVQ